MNKKIFSALFFVLMMLASITGQAQQRLIVTAVTGGAEYIDKGHKSPLGKGATLTLETKVYIPYNGSLTVIDEATSKEYTVKSIGWAALEEKLADSKHTVLTRTKDYVKTVLAEVRKTPKVKARYVSDPATVTREKYVKKEAPQDDFRAAFDAFSKKTRQEYDDFRKKASLINLNDTKEVASYTYEKDDCEESGYSVKKYAEVNLDACAANNDTWWSMCEGYSSSSLDNKMQGDHFEDFYLMRYSDVLLMLTELTGDASYMNQVQRRAGVPETPYSLKAVQDERRWEFAFEGLRFNDMRRWTGNKPNENSYAPKALQAQSGKQIICLGDKSNKRTMKHMTCSWAKRYIDTNGFLAKPQTEITVKNGKLKQNPGWDAANAETQYKVLY